MNMAVQRVAPGADDDAVDGIEKNKNCHFCEHAPKRCAVFACLDPVCDQMFCENCMKRHLGRPTSFKGQPDASAANWRCPICTKVCCCTQQICNKKHLHCKRYRRRIKQSSKRVGPGGGCYLGASEFASSATAGAGPQRGDSAVAPALASALALPRAYVLLKPEADKGEGGELGSGDGDAPSWQQKCIIGKEGVCRPEPSATLAEKAPEDLEGLPPLKKLRLDVSERQAYLKQGLIKWFEEHCGFFRGTVRAYDAKSDVYKIAYAADDEEDMSYEEMKSLVLRGTGGGSMKVVSSYGSWWVAAENDTPRRIAAELAKRGPGRGALQAEQIVELNKRQYPALLVTSRLRKNTLIFLGAGGGRAVGVEAGSEGGAQDAAGAVSVSLDACKQLSPAPMSPSRDTVVGGEGDGPDDICEGSHVGVSICWGSRPGERSAEGVVGAEPETQDFHVVVPENVKPGQQFCARIGTDGPLMNVLCPENCGPGTTLQVKLPKAALPWPKNLEAVRNSHQASSGGGGGYPCSRSPLTTRKPLAPSFKRAGIGIGMGAMCSAFPFQRRLLEEASGASVGATVAEAQARTCVSVAFDGGEDEAVRRGGGDILVGQGGVDERVRCSRPRDAPKGGEGGGGDVIRALVADVGIDTECVMCMDAEKSHAFVPCGHMCVCKGCAGKIMGANKECPFCCSVATAVMRVFT